MKTKNKMKTAVNNFVNYTKKGIKSFSEIYIPETVISVDVSGNYSLLSFEGLSSFPQMTTLKANNTRISTFKGVQNQISLLNLSLLNTPLSKEKHLTIMSLVMFGTSLQNVNGKRVSPEMRKLALSIKLNITPYLERGYLISQVEPQLKIHLPGSQKDIIVDLSYEEFKENEKIISENEKKIIEMKEKLLQLQKEKRENKIAKVDKEKLVRSFISQSPKKIEKSSNTSTTNKSKTIREKPKNTDSISPTVTAKPKHSTNNKINPNKSKQKSSTNLNTEKQIEQQNKNKPKTKIADSNESEKEIISIINDQKEINAEYNFNFSDEDNKAEEPTEISIDMKDEIPMNEKPKNIYTINDDYLNDSQLIDIGNGSPPPKTTEQAIDNDLYNEILNSDDEEKELINEENKGDQNEFHQKENDQTNSNIGNDNDQAYSDKIEFKENINDEQVDNIFNFSDENTEEEEDAPDVAALKLDMSTPKKPYIIEKDFSDDDPMIDFADEDPITTDT